MLTDFLVESDAWEDSYKEKSEHRNGSVSMENCKPHSVFHHRFIPLSDCLTNYIDLFCL